MRNIIIISSLALICGGAAIAGRGMKEAPAAVSTGYPVSCIPLHMVRESKVRNDRVIDFRVNGNKWYRNTLPYACPSLGFEERFSYRTSLSSLCSTDIITVLTQYGAQLGRGASCGLGKFQPVTIAKPTKR